MFNQGCAWEKHSVSHSSISSNHDSLLCIELRRPFHKYSKENEISKEYKASYNKKSIIEDFKRYRAWITLKLGFLLAFYNNKTALFPYGYHGKFQLFCIIMILFIFFFSLRLLAAHIFSYIRQVLIPVWSRLGRVIQTNFEMNIKRQPRKIVESVNAWGLWKCWSYSELAIAVRRGYYSGQFWMSVCRYRVANIDQVYIVSSQASTYIQLIEQLINSKPLKGNPYLTLGAFDFSLPLEGGLGWLRKNTPQTHRRKWKKLSQRAKSRMFSQCINFDHSSRILPNYSIEPPTHPFWRP